MVGGALVLQTPPRRERSEAELLGPGAHASPGIQRPFTAVGLITVVLAAVVPVTDEGGSCRCPLSTGTVLGGT